MGSLRHTATGRTSLLEPEHVVGRAPTCALRLTARYVSAQHAMLRWTGLQWALRDLASSNGTFLDGSRLATGEETTAKKGARLAFGNLEEEWRLVDESSPPVMAVPLDEGEPLQMDGELLAVPSPDDPQVTIYRSAEGYWCIEHADETVVSISNLELFHCAGRAYKFCCPENTCTTFRLAGKVVRDIALKFAVSRDEEYVELEMTCGGRKVDMGARACTYLLLTLARFRQKDAQDGLPDGSCGWIDYEGLAHDPRMAPPQLNIDVFRIRRMFAAEGVEDAVNIIERRPLSRQLRIGTAHITVVQL